MGSKTFQELHDQDEIAEAGTPKRCIVLDADPRSPTIGLDRTPITVAATPAAEPAENKQPSQPAVLHDPRSPTNGIDRTPIYSTRPEITEAKKESVIQQSHLARHLFQNNYDSLVNENDSLMQEEDQHEEASDNEEEQDEANLLHFHTPMKEPILTTNELVGHGDLSPFVDRVSLNELVKSTKTEQSDVGAELADLSENKLTLSDRSEQKTKISKIPVSKTRKSPVNSSNAKTEMVTQRSPLAPRNVDSDTPKALIQRKQMRNIAMQVKNQSCQSQLVSSGLPRHLQMCDDKENL